MRESDIEQYLVERVAELRGECRKLKWVARKGAPDRLVMLPGGLLHFVELKAPGLAAKFPYDAHTRQQHREHVRMERMGQKVYVIDSKEGVDALLGVGK